MTRNGYESTRTAAHTGPGGRSRASRTVRGRGGRRLLAPLAGIAAAAALIAGCGSAGTEEPAGDPGAGTTEAAPTSEQETDPGQDPSDGGEGDPTEGGQDNDDAMGENLFEGTWGFGHDTKVLSAEELAALLEAEAEARGPEEMSLGVECGDGVDTGAGDYDAECIAYADEGVEHLWLVTVGPADAGLEIEVENAS